MFSREEFKEKIANKVKDFESKSHEGESERDICRAYIEPLFSYLGWHMEDTNEVKEQKNQPEGRPDYIFYLNGSIAFYLEAKIVRTLAEEDIKQALNYARSKNKRWAVLSNFQDTIILICDTKEVSLSQHIFRRIPYNKLSQDLSDILLLSRESFEQGTIEEKAQEEGRIKQTTKIDEELLNDILSWRKKLIDSIKKNNRKQYSKEELEEIAQTLLNRIIFIRTAEDRKHEAQPDETLKEIINQYESNKYIIIKDKVNKLFREYDTAYDSKLFTYDDTDFKNRHECESVNVDNNTYYKILKGTYDKNEIYQYRFDEIDANVLGSMYEKYIGNIQAFRKKQGIYYTPTFVVNYIVENTIGDELKSKKPKQVESLRILDMACGSGSFLLGAFDFLNAYYKQKNKKYSQTELDIGELARITQKTKILKNNLFGVDLDKKAVEITQLNLLLKIAETKYRLPDLKENIRYGDSLRDDRFNYDTAFPAIMNKGKFDVIISNPPWVQSKFLDEADKRYYSENYKVAKRQYDLFTLFIEKGLRLLKNNGTLGFIVPDRFTTNSDYSVFRKYLLDNTLIREIVHLGEGVFEGVEMPSAILIIEKSDSESKRNKNLVRVRLGIKSAPQMIKQESFSKNDGFVFDIFGDGRLKPIIRQIEKNSQKLSEFVENGRGVEIGKKSDLVSESSGDVRFLIGSDIGRYQIKGHHYLKLGRKGVNYKEPFLYEGEKILVRKTGLGINAVLDTNSYVIQVIYIFKGKSKDINLRYILGLLNSELMTFYYFSKFGQKGRKVFPHLTQDKILQLPIKIDLKREERIASLVDEIQKQYNHLNQMRVNSEEKIQIKSTIDRINDELNETVYEIYGITDKAEKETIKRSLESK